jgi:hypothetical protein
MQKGEIIKELLYYWEDQSLFLENALPEGVFKYSSNSMALCRSEKAMAVLICQGLYLEV